MFSLSLLVYYTYPSAKSYLSTYNTVYYKYRPKELVTSKVDTSRLAPAQAVPVLMYHGIVNSEDKNNTDLNHFISHMEMLKIEGYETITMSELDLFFDGKFTLPPKPIIITFDDGRKDSYYPTDSVLKKLGFKATIFVATARANNGDSFFLSWNELMKLKNSGRWEIEAHGRNSHDKIKQSENNEMGNYLTSRMIKEDGLLESVDEYEARVEQDYINGILDLKNNLGIDAHYYAIPLNEYEQKPVPNYPGYADFNKNMIRKYFKIALIQAVVGPEIVSGHKPVYNYFDTNKHFVSRISPKNMDTDKLKNLLDSEAPEDPNVIYTDTELLKNIKSSYGKINLSKNGLELHPSKEYPSTRVLYGSYQWKNYTVVAKIQNVKGRSVSLMSYVNEENDNISFGITDSGLFLRQTIDGKEIPLRPSILMDKRKKGTVDLFEMEFKDNFVTCYSNNKIVFKNVPFDIKKGRIGFKAWDGKGNGLGVISSIVVYPTIDK